MTDNTIELLAALGTVGVFLACYIATEVVYRALIKERVFHPTPKGTEDSTSSKVKESITYE